MGDIPRKHGKHKRITPDEVEEGYELYKSGIRSCKALGKAMGRSEGVARKLIYEGMFGLPGYKYRLEEESTALAKTAREVAMDELRNIASEEVKVVTEEIVLINALQLHLLKEFKEMVDNKEPLTLDEKKEIFKLSAKKGGEVLAFFRLLLNTEEQPSVTEEKPILPSSKTIDNVLESLPDDAQGKVLELLIQDFESSEVDDESD